GLSSQPLNQFDWLHRLELGADIFLFEKTLKSAPIDEPTSTSDSDRYLGWEPDFYMNWQITSDLTLAMRYGLFFPSNGEFDAVKDLGGDKVRSLFFTGVTYAF
ncbi:MAG TPA: hypothetical protein VL992_07635, partial [Tepidisphaeraceae bacterium]|nr:hypothetical protein [Tepidisphaeraceae bacterium]